MFLMPWFEISKASHRQMFRKFIYLVRCHSVLRTWSTTANKCLFT